MVVTFVSMNAASTGDGRSGGEMIIGGQGLVSDKWYKGCLQCCQGQSADLELLFIMWRPG